MNKYSECGREGITSQKNTIRDHGMLWVDTIYWTFQSDLKEMDVKYSFLSKQINFSYIPDNFWFVLEKVSPKDFTVELFRDVDVDRVLDTELDGDYEEYDLFVSFTLVNGTGLTKENNVHPLHDTAKVSFTLDELYALGSRNDVWMIKCVVWMIEYSCLSDHNYEEQEGMMQKKIDEIAADPKQCEQLAAAMHSDTLKNMFTGRQNIMFADCKSTLLQRSLRYSDKLLYKIEWHQTRKKLQVSAKELESLLGYIFTGKNSGISKKDCIILFASAYYFGLWYLISLCTTFIRLSFFLKFDIDFLIDVLIVADLVDDLGLMDVAMNWFLENKRKVLNSDSWNNFKNRNYELAYGFTMTLRKKETNLSSVFWNKPIAIVAENRYIINLNHNV